MRRPRENFSDVLKLVTHKAFSAQDVKRLMPEATAIVPFTPENEAFLETFNDAVRDKVKSDLYLAAGAVFMVVYLPVSYSRFASFSALVDTLIVIGAVMGFGKMIDSQKKAADIILDSKFSGRLDAPKPNHFLE